MDASASSPPRHRGRDRRAAGVDHARLTADRPDPPRRRFRPAPTGLERAAAKGHRRFRSHQVKLLTPIPWPNKVVAFPVNYHAHGAEMGRATFSTNQGFFLKPNSSLSGAGEPVVLPDLPAARSITSELGIVISKTARNVARAISTGRTTSSAMPASSTWWCAAARARRPGPPRHLLPGSAPGSPPPTGFPTDRPAHAPLGRRRTAADANTRDLVLDIPGMIEMASAVMTRNTRRRHRHRHPEGSARWSRATRSRIEIDHCGR